MATLFRFIFVGILNTAIGYCFILAFLFSGLGDYSANFFGFALAMPVSFLLHRSLTFQERKPLNLPQAVRYSAALAAAYAVNLGIVTLGRHFGYVGSPIVQGVAIGVYAGVFFLLCRAFVFTGQENEIPGQAD